jgi:hypothetical protein
MPVLPLKISSPASPFIIVVLWDCIICFRCGTGRKVESQKLPSRLLSTFIWSHFVATTKDESEPQKLYVVNHVVNLRLRFDPSQPESSFGNLFSVAITVSSLNTGEKDHGLVH